MNNSTELVKPPVYLSCMEVIEKVFYSSEEMDWAFVPTVPGTKKPLYKASQNIPAGIYPQTSSSCLNLMRCRTKDGLYKLCVLDVDTDGAESLLKFKRTYNPPETFTVSTPSGGWHLYYLIPINCNFEISQGGYPGHYPGITFLCDYMQAMAPGSITNEIRNAAGEITTHSGMYLLANSAAIAVLPQAIVNALTPRSVEQEAAPDFSWLPDDVVLAEANRRGMIR